LSHDTCIYNPILKKKYTSNHDTFYLIISYYLFELTNRINKIKYFINQIVKLKKLLKKKSNNLLIFFRTNDHFTELIRYNFHSKDNFVNKKILANDNITITNITFSSFSFTLFAFTKSYHTNQSFSPLSPIKDKKEKRNVGGFWQYGCKMPWCFTESALCPIILCIERRLLG